MTATARDLVELFVPAYGRPEGLVRAVESGLAETPFRVTVLDDCSPEPAREALAAAGIEVGDDRLRVLRNPCNLGASLNILRALEVSRAPYTWPLADDQLVRPGAGAEVVEAIEAMPATDVLFWNRGLSEGERVDVTGLEDYVGLVERDRGTFGFSDVHFNRVVKTEVGRRYLRLDARFSHVQPMLGLQIAAIADGSPAHFRGGTLARPQEGGESGWSGSYAQRFKFDLGYVIPDPELRRRYRAVVARHALWRVTLVDAAGAEGSIDEAFAVDAARLAAHSRIPLRLRAEARLALFLRTSRIGRLLGRAVPRKRGARRTPGYEDTTW